MKELLSLILLVIIVSCRPKPWKSEHPGIKDNYNFYHYRDSVDNNLKKDSLEKNKN